MFDFIVNYIFLFLLIISVLVTIHELGHYWAARLFKIKIGAFAVGLGPIIWKKIDKSGTEWRICLLPLGGYVLFAGLSNNSDNPHEPPRDPNLMESFRYTIYGTHPLKKIFIFFAGPLANIIIAFILFIFLFLEVGSIKYPLEISNIHQTQYENELQVGDAIIKINGKLAPTSDEDWTHFLNAERSITTTSYLVSRDGQEVEALGAPLNLARVGAVIPNSAAFDAGLMVGDVITGVNSYKIEQFKDMAEIVQSSNGGELIFEVWRGDKSIVLPLTPRLRPIDDGAGLQEIWMVGIRSFDLPFDFDLKSKNIGFINAIEFSWKNLLRRIEGTFSGFSAIITGAISTCNLSGPVGMAEITGNVAQQGSFEIFSLIASISLALAIFNLLPVPPFDGFHILYTASNWVLGGRIPHSAQHVVSIVGFAIFVSAFLFITWQDIFCI